MARSDFGVNFNGRNIVHPGGYDAIDASAMQGLAGTGANLPIVVGTADAGKSGVVKWFASSEDAEAYLRGGDLLKALKIMFSPTPDGGGAALIGAMVANSTVQATLSVGGTKLTSIEYGDGGNRIQVKMEDGTIANTKKFTATRWDIDTTEVYTNVGAVIQLSHTGHPYAVVSVVVVNGAATKLETKIGGSSVDALVDLSLDLTSGQFVTIDDLIAYINGVSGYRAKYVDYNSSGLTVDKLDALSLVDIANGGYLLAVKGDLAHRLNNKSALVNVEIIGSLTNFPSTYLAGGSKGTAPSSWANLLNVLKSQYSDLLVVLSSDSTIHAEALAHVNEMENRHQKQVLFTGGAVGESADDAKSRSLNLNSSRAVLAWPGIYHSVHNSGKTPMAPYFTAAMLAGRVAGVDASEPITFDYFSILGLEVDQLAGDPQVDDLITSGVATLERVSGRGFRLVQGITTYQQSNNVLYREISVRRGADKLSEQMRATLEEMFVGKKGVKATPSAVTTKVVEILEQAIRDGEIVSYRNIVVRMVGTVIYVDYQVAPVEPTNFVLITTHFVPDSV